MPGTVAAWLAGSAALVQAAVLLLVVPTARRLRSPPLAFALVTTGIFMAFRRLLEAMPAAIDGPAGLGLAHGAAGLAVSVLIGVGCMSLARRRLQSDESPASNGVLDVGDIAAAREEEREILSYDLHDGLAQYVLAAQMHLDTFAALRAGKPERAEEELDHARLRLRQAAREVHRTVSALSVRVSPEVCLGDAIRQYTDQLCETQGWRCEIEDNVGHRRFAPPVETMVFRIVQEALANAAKHAQTDRVNVLLQVEGGCLVAVVRDWGVGFVPVEAPCDGRQVGLRSMWGRARLLGGWCEVESAPGMGASVTIRVPCPEEESDAHAYR